MPSRKLAYSLLQNNTILLYNSYISEQLFAAEANQPTVRFILTGLSRFLFSNRVGEIIKTIGYIDPELGHGFAEYRHGSNMLSSRPTTEGEVPAEINFRPTIPHLGIDGAIHWHGEGSNYIPHGILLGFHLDQELREGRYANYLQIRRSSGGLAIGHTEETLGELITPAQALIDDVTDKVTKLVELV